MEIEWEFDEDDIVFCMMNDWGKHRIVRTHERTFTGQRVYLVQRIYDDGMLSSFTDSMDKDYLERRYVKVGKWNHWAEKEVEDDT